MEGIGVGVVAWVYIGDVVQWGVEGDCHLGVVRYFAGSLVDAFVEEVGGKRGVFVKVPVAQLAVVAAPEAA